MSKIMNVYEYIAEKIKRVGNEIGEVLLEGDAYFNEWEAISTILFECDKFLDFLKRRVKDE